MPSISSAFPEHTTLPERVAFSGAPAEHSGAVHIIFVGTQALGKRARREHSPPFWRQRGLLSR